MNYIVGSGKKVHAPSGSTTACGKGNSSTIKTTDAPIDCASCANISPYDRAAHRAELVAAGVPMKPIEPTPAELVEASRELVEAFGGVAPEIVTVTAVEIGPREYPAHEGDEPAVPVSDPILDLLNLLAPMDVEIYAERYVHGAIPKLAYTMCGVPESVYITSDYATVTCPYCAEALESIAAYLRAAERPVILSKHKASAARRRNGKRIKR